MISVKEAQSLILNEAKNFGIESIPLAEATGRVLAEDIMADRDYPPFNRSAMDGFAINSKDFIHFGKRDFQVIEEILAGQTAQKPLTVGSCFKIMTGAPVPENCDAVIRIEDTSMSDEGIATMLCSTIKEGQNIASQGEDCKYGELVVPSSTPIDALALGALAALGKSQVSVFRYPSITIISTGDEIKSIHDTILSHQIRDSNKYTLTGFLKNYSIKDIKTEIVQDNREKLKAAITKSLQTDILILSGGVSMGDADYVPDILQSLGAKKIFHKVKLKPGKPLWFGTFPNGPIVFALPGNPLSVQISFKVFIEPFLRACIGQPELTYLTLPLLTARNKKVQLDEFIPSYLTTEKRTGVVPKKINGSGDITATLFTHGIMLHEHERGDIMEGELVKFFPWNSI